MTGDIGAPLIFVHPSDELYGADRMLLEMVELLTSEQRDRAQLWLPTDLEHPPAPLCAELQQRGLTVRHLDLPILRRAYRTPRGMATLAGRGRRLLRELRQVSPELVYCTTSAAFAAAPLARRAGVPVVVGHVQELWSRSDRVVLGRLAGGCDRLLAISEAVASRVPERLQERLVVVPNATREPKSIAPIAGRSGPLEYVVASRWNAWKGHRTLLAAWDQAGSPGHLTVLGGPPPSGDAVDVPGLVAALGDPESVRVVGEVPDPDPYLEAADVMVMPSDQPEPFGLVAIEAFARGRPVIGSAAGGLADIISDGVDGWSYPPGDAQALSRVLAALTRPRVEEAGGRARSTYEARYTLDRYSRDWRAAVGFDADSLAPRRPGVGG